MRLIDADALMSLFVTKAQTMKDTHGVKLGEEWLLNYNDIKDVIDNAPTVDVIPNKEGYEMYNKGYASGYERCKEERPRGEWIMEDKPYGGFGDSVLAITCSICKESYIYRDTTHNYCPNCGAYMRKEANNEQTN